MPTWDKLKTPGVFTAFLVNKKGYFDLVCLEKHVADAAVR